LVFKRNCIRKKNKTKKRYTGRHGLGTGDHPDLLLDKGGGGGDAGTRDPRPPTC
jgi:hypothetical protein